MNNNIEPGAQGDFNYDTTTKVICRSQKSKWLEHCGLGEFMWKYMKKHANKVAQIDALSGEKDLYGDLLLRATRTAMEMQNLGIKQGDLICICSHNHLNSLVPYLAAQFVGAIIASTDPTISEVDNEYLMDLIKPEMIFLNAASEDMFVGIFKKIGHECQTVGFAETTQMMPFSDFLKPKEGEEHFQPTHIKNTKDTAIIFFSSGTTGYPKGICISHNFMLFNVSNFGMWSDTEILLSYATLYWISTTLLLFFAIYNGTARMVCSSFDPDVFWKYLLEYKVDMVFLAPTQAIRCLKTAPEQIKTSLKYFLVGGSPISPVYLQKLRDYLPDVDVGVGYGQSEVGLSSVFTPADAKFKYKLESAGLPLPGFLFKVVDSSTDTALGFNQPGELRVKGPSILNGYYKQDSSDCFDDEGFFKTGDVVYYDEDFCLFITDRIKEMFKYLSWHIIPAKLEAILETHPAVAMGAVIGIPHPEDDNHAMGVVVLNKGAEATGKEIELFIEGQVDERNRLRAGVKIVDTMPYTPTGKIKRRELRDMVINGLL